MEITVAPSYLPPSDKDIHVAATSAGLKVNAPDFVRNVCNIKAGGEYLSQEGLSREIGKILKEKPIKYTDGAAVTPGISGKSRKFLSGFSGTEHATESAARDEFIKHHHKLAGKMRNTIEALPALDVPGGSPMTQAVNLLKILAAQRGQNKEGQEENEFLDSVLDSNNIAEAKKNLEAARNMSQPEYELLDQLEEAQNENKKESSGDGGNGVSDGYQTGMTDKGKAIMKAAVALTDAQMRDVIKVSRRMKSMSKLKASKVTTFVPDVQESEVRNRSMKGYDEIRRIKSGSLSMLPTARPLFNYRAVTGQFSVRERGKYTEKKQLLYMLVDCSGSMSEGRRISLAGGVLVNRLLAVASGDAALFWRFFDTRAHEATYVDCKDNAHKSINSILQTGNYHGGGTNFDQAITCAVEHIESLKATVDFAKPEIMMVTDGQCHCHLQFKDLKGIKLHTALVSNDNENSLKMLSMESGGLYMNLATIK